MLLRNASSHDRDPDIFHTMTSHNPAAAGPHEAHSDMPAENGTTANYYGNNTAATHNNHDLDDIWATPSYLPPHPQSHPHPQHNSHHHHHHQYPYPPQEPTVSDIPRLSAAHSTAGYRDGITLAKARTAQGGFDEGYGLGATIGARAGQLLGVLEGLAAAVGLQALSEAYRGQGQGAGMGMGMGGKGEARRIERLLTEARRELSVTGVFDGEYWAQDGNWRYQVGGGGQQQQYGDGCGGGGGQGLGEGDGGVVFTDVAEAHPLLRKWGGIVRAEAARYGVDWEVLKDEVGDARREGEEEEREREGRMRRERGGQPAARGREALAW
ncbi:uncharacterized protein B0H64DRAFT_428609 [Chaetomium fimeti]|uniref:Protein YAE1 n=1 Tax=Chaetomium fimeti TaxID=1854472 RepID=A0AAE0HQ05_9PEZI|nr:hypothetical protein B0H64DRAFT_428609 [Chaetomium fimeti]